MLCIVAQYCPTLCDPTDCSLPGFSVYGDSPGKNTVTLLYMENWHNIVNELYFFFFFESKNTFIWWYLKY